MSSCRVLDIEHLTENTFKLRVERPKIKIISGQCFNVGIPGIGINREYSMYSSADSEYIDFLIRSVDDGLISKELQKLKTGDWVEVDGAYGEFCLKDPSNENLSYLFIATGTGIAPFHSFIKTYTNLNYNIVHGVRTEDECYDSENYKSDAYVSCISRPSGAHKPRRVTDYLFDLEIPKKTQVYICGNRNMIIDVFEILFTKGISSNQIVTEVFF